uniref:Uncharacterized protein n=1 Tax=Chrysotila carterae TaxID=13221 RepID=A0A7S4ET28_CHRCT|mmetsp:Transcript_24202/g.47233  ORF Transcript_24202/g.47233 Transcript_24202/m.47233 type:complete len:156 (-) Transcript_24202:582-1049(-)|eukprot:6213271-Pleurochrysis_carterae.AAC.3
MDLKARFCVDGLAKEYHRICHWPSRSLFSRWTAGYLKLLVNVANVFVWHFNGPGVSLQLLPSALWTCSQERQGAPPPGELSLVVTKSKADNLLDLALKSRVLSALSRKWSTGMHSMAIISSGYFFCNYIVAPSSFFNTVKAMEAKLHIGHSGIVR